MIKIVSLAWSKKKGTRKQCVDDVMLEENHGVRGDAHAGDWHRQVSFLAAESIEGVRQKGLDISFGDFAENIATEGIDWKAVPVGTRYKLGDAAVVEITQIGKVCHTKCAIYYQAGDCIMPKEGTFARVITGGRIKCGDTIEPMHETSG
ncbi:MAG: MOSC domain-containing protein [Desulfobacteraceae bacterium]|nr:MOSC domain-containing protein [Desulfobacteraceae bacterium]